MMKKGLLAAVVGLAAAGVLGADGERYPDQFVFAHRNLAIPSQLPEMSNIVYNAAACGYNGLVFWCGTHYAGRWNDLHSRERPDAAWRAETSGIEDVDIWTPERRARLLAMDKLCTKLHCPLIPLVWSVGYCSMQSREPNMTAAAPVRDVPYVRKGDKAVWVHEAFEMPNGGFETATAEKPLAGWRTDGKGDLVFRDEAVKHSGAASARFVCDPLAGTKGVPMARAYRPVKVRPNRRYRLSAWYKTKDLGFTVEGSPRLMVVAGDTTIGSRGLRMSRTQDWTRYEITFNALEASEVLVYVGAWKITSGTLWVDDVSIEPVGVRDVVRREGTPVRVRDAATGRVYREGVDYAPIPGVKMLDFESRAGDLAIGIPSGSAIPPDAKLLVDAYEPVIAAGVQYSACLANPELKRYYAASARRIEDLLSPDKWFLSADEFRAGCRCELCTKAGSRATLYAQTIRDQYEAIQAVHPGATCYVWADMLDPNHNGKKNYYLCGDMTPRVDLLPKELVMVSWWDEKSKLSFDYFSSLGFRTMGAGYYDQMTPDRTIKNAQKWLDSRNATPGCRGILYTTWSGERGNYEFLPLFYRVVERYGTPKK